MAVISEKFDELGLADEATTYKIGIMGGTFDPIHIGHLACAEQVREIFSLDAVIFVPAGNPVFKQGQKVTSAQQRLEMCRGAVASNPFFDVSSIEVDRPGKTFTVDTLRALRNHYPDNVELYFITGADAVVSILNWKSSEEVAQLAHFVAASRPGYVMDDALKRYIASESDFSVHYTEVTALSLASSDLRAMVSQGRSIRYLTMQSVYDYVREHALYQEDTDD